LILIYLIVYIKNYKKFYVLKKTYLDKLNNVIYLLYDEVQIFLGTIENDN